MKKILMVILFLTSCSSEKIIKNDFNFDNKMSFNEFKIKLEEYANNSPYPNIDN
tara:strand:+ start:640 stop:801 length:162 start_codon:yes stop_codon:yes gene_type:complete